MRYDVKKFIFIGIAEEKINFFKKAQEIGIVDFIDISGKAKETPVEISNLVAAIKVLRGLPTADQETLTEFTLANGLVNKILEYKHKLEKLEEEKRLVHLEITRVNIFGDYSKDDLAYIEHEGHSKIQFFFAKHGITEEHPLPKEVLFVGTDHNLDYFISINDSPRMYDHLIEMRIDHTSGELRTRYHEIWKEIHELQAKLKKFAKYNKFLHQALTYKLNQHNLLVAQNDVKLKMDDSLFVIQGWVPVNKEMQLQQIVKDLDVHSEEIAIEEKDVVPTYLENKGIPKLGEDIVHVYDTPSPTDKDPSMWVLVFFSLFFAFIVGDGGYGLIFLVIALYMRYKFGPMKGAKMRFMKLFTILACACIGWGLLTNSFFGITFGPDSPMRKVSVINWLVEKKAEYHLERKDDTYQYWVKEFPNLKGIEDPHQFISEGIKTVNGISTHEIINKFTDNIMMELALVLGMVHIILSMLRYSGRNLVNIGWMLFIVGGYMYLPHYLKTASILDYIFDINRDTLAMDGLYLMGGGVALATILAVYKHKFLGLLEPMVGIQVFSDIMSYLRLYALGLAGAMVTATINEAAGAAGIVLGALLLIVGNGINIVLSVMGGVIHGLRLNFLEWYHYSFEGGGKMFKPLRKMPIE
jgi:V/A-type H+-transporting ATPase subunit I